MNLTDAKPRVALLIGGVSGEHSISCLTAAGVLRNIDRDRFDVVVLGITRAGSWVLVPDDPEPLEGGVAEVPAGAPPVALVQGQGGVRVEETRDGHVDHGRVDVVFPLLHGPFGEDGTVQGMFEILGIRYVGPGVLASAAGMDKHFTKVQLQAAGLPVGRYVAIPAARWERGRAEALADCESLALPLFVKPARAGSSLGITRVEDYADLPAAIEAAREHDPKVIVEEGVVGREIEVAVLGGRGGSAPRVAPPGEVVMDDVEDNFYDWQTKYFSHDAVTMACPADLPDNVTKQIEHSAAAAFEALGCEGLARIDFFYRADGGISINEINTMPGMTPFSMYPFMWQRAGLSYRDLMTELIELALARPLGLR